MTKRGEQPIDHDEEVQKSMERNLVQQAEQIAPVVEKFLERIRDREVPKEYKKFEELSPFVVVDSRYSGLMFKFIYVRGCPGMQLEDLQIEPEDVLDKRLTKLGIFLKGSMENQTVYDLGSSSYSAVEDLAVAFGAKEYVGVDLFLVQERHKQVRDTDVYSKRDEILQFVSKMKDEAGGFFCLSGLERSVNDDDKEVKKEYYEALIKELNRVMKSGNIMVFGLATNFIDPVKHGFEEMFREPGVDWAGIESDSRQTIRVYKKK